MPRSVLDIVRTKKLEGALPLIATAVLAALLSADSLLTVRQLVLTLHATPDAVALPRRPPRRAGADSADAVSSIVAAHLFGLSTAQVARVDPDSAPVSASDLALTGTIARKNTRRGFAIVSNGGHSSLYAVGASLGGAVLSAVYPDHILLDRDGTLEKVLLPRAKLLAGQAGSNRTGLARASSAAESDAPAAADGVEINNVVRAGAAVMGEGGHMRGFRLSPGNDAAAFEAAGLKKGDVVVALNGAAVTGENHWSGEALFESVAASPQATLTIERNGQTQDVVLKLAQAHPSAEATLPAAAAESASMSAAADDSQDQSP